MEMLKPCPFCGGTAKIYGDKFNGYDVSCNECGCKIGCFEGRDGLGCKLDCFNSRGECGHNPTIKKAISSWNKRA